MIKTKNTRAILFGVSEYQDKKNFSSTPAIKTNVSKLKILLENPEILDLKEENILICGGKQDPVQILESIRDFLAEGEGVLTSLIFYFAGHGLREDTSKDFYFSTYSTKKKHLTQSAIPWEGKDNLKYIFENEFGIQERLYIIDACHSGAMTLGGEEKVIEYFDYKIIKEGSALIAAAKVDKLSYYDQDATYTHFSGEFIKILEDGIENHQKKELSLSAITQKLAKEVKEKNSEFEIKIKNTFQNDATCFFKNKGFSPLALTLQQVAQALKEADKFFENNQFRQAIQKYKEAIFTYTDVEQYDTNKVKKIKTKISEVQRFQKMADEIELWNDAKHKNTKEAFQNYLKKYPKGKYKIEANEKKINFDKVQNERPVVSYNRPKPKPKNAFDFKKNLIPFAFLLLGFFGLQACQTWQKEKPKQEDTYEVANQEAKIEKEINQNYTETAQGLNFEMIAVEGGTFQMGSNDGYDDAKLHTVKLSCFQVGKYEVTQKLWKAVMGTNPSQFKGDNLPVERVSWNDIQDFLRKLNTMTGKNYRLPTEAEWEFAARGGNKSRSYKYAGKSNENDLKDYAWFDENSFDLGEKDKDFGTHQVGTKFPNELGIYDMSGNVWEWCQDWYDKNFYSKNQAKNNPVNDIEGSGRVIRGGSWNYYSIDTRVAIRNHYRPQRKWNGSGFRLVSSLPCSLD